MQDLENLPEHQEYKLGKYKFIFPKNLSYETFSDTGYRGICFLIDEHGYQGEKFGRYQVIDNIYLGFRMIISNMYGWQDMPFKKETFRFLPASITVIEEE
jgi:hypothetical protein